MRELHAVLMAPLASGNTHPDTEAVMKNALGTLALVLIVMVTFSSVTLPISVLAASPTLDIWWPTAGATVSGTQPFKGMLENTDVGDYSMYWSVDGGQENPMGENNSAAPHYESAVDLSGWTWHGAGPYAVTFTAVENGTTVASKTVSIYVPSAQSVTAPQTASAPTAIAQTPKTSPAQIQTWWPTAGITISGVQPFKALVPGMDTDNYTMYWSVDGGQENLMQTAEEGGTHKEASVDLSGWTWHGAGPYQLTFTAKDNSGNVIATESFSIGVQNAQPTISSVIAPQNVATASPTETNPVVANSSDPLSSMTFYADSNSEAAIALSAGITDPATLAATKLLAQTPSGIWLGGWNSDVEETIASTVQTAAAKQQTPIFVAYNIPNRDCGGYSAGGAQNDTSYQAWVQQIATGLGNSSAVVILEPDALSVTSCLSTSQLDDRETLLASAVETLKQDPNAKIYLDAGHENWIAPTTMASELSAAGIANANGFAVNVSNFMPTSGEEAYGAQISQALGTNTHFVIDTSRNGEGSDGQWCNPPAALGNLPTTNTGDTLVDAFLWLKPPGESDGSCSGGPTAGDWWPSYALSLVQNANLL